MEGGERTRGLAGRHPVAARMRLRSGRRLANAVGAAALLVVLQHPVSAQSGPRVGLAPVHAAWIRPIPIQPTPIQPTPIQPTPIQPTPIQPTPIQPVPGQPAPDQPIPGAPEAGRAREAWVGGILYGIEAGYARAVAPGYLIGWQVGLLSQTGRTLAPGREGDAEPDLEEYLHAAALLRVRPRPGFEVDLGVRGGWGDLWPCPASDCLPVPFYAAYVQPMIGWRRIKLGARLSVGRISETRPSSAGSTAYVALHPLLVRWTWPLTPR